MKCLRVVAVVGAVFCWAGLACAGDISIMLSHGDWLHLGGDTIVNEIYPANHKVEMLMQPPTTGTVTGPKIQLTSDRSFTRFDIYPTSTIEPSTYVWDYPEKSLTNGQPPIDIDCDELSTTPTPGFTASRTVDNPILLADVNDITVNFTIRFEEPLPPSIDHMFAKIGFWWDRDVVVETILDQNDVPGWTSDGDGTWFANPNDISFGVDYDFQAQIRCTKQPEYQGTTIFYKPEVSIHTADWTGLPLVTGPNTFITLPEGDTAQFQVNESVTWYRSAYTHKQHLFLERLAVPVDNHGLAVDSLEIWYLDAYSPQGADVGYHFGVDAYGHNIVSGDVNTPTNRVFGMEEFEEGRCNLWFDGFSMADFNALGVVSGVYDLLFEDHLEGSVTTSIELSCSTPTQVPNVTYPLHETNDIDPATYITWDQVWDANINTILLFVYNDEETWESSAELSADQNSVLITGMPPCAGISCHIVFANTESGHTPEGIDCVARKGTHKYIHFTTTYCSTCWDQPNECAGQPDGDATCDGNVNLADLFALKAHFGTSAPWADNQCCADFSHDGNVDLADLYTLKAGFGSSGYSPSTLNQTCPP
jgi:hypothetical protein